MNGKMLIKLVAFGLAAMATAVDAADPWPTFRGPSGNGIADTAASAPTTWSAKKNVAWRTPLPGTGWSSPVIGGGRIYLTAAISVDGESGSAEGGEKSDAGDFDLCLLVLDERSGELIDQHAVMRQSHQRTPKIHSKNSHASPTPILNGDRVYLHFGYQGTACVTRNGDPIWTNRELFFKPTHGNGGSPVLVEGKLVFTCDGDKQPRVVALDAATGEIVWEQQRPVRAKKTFSFCTPTVINVAGRKQIVAPGSDCVLGLDPATGDVIWDVRYDGYSVVPKPVFHGGLVVLSTGFDSSKMFAIRPNGRGVVTDSHVEWRQNKFVPKTPSMIAHQGRIYSVSDNGIATCIDSATGELIYRERLGGNFSASPVLVGDNLYFTNERGVTTVAKTGDRFRKLAENDLGERTLASFAVSDQALVVRTDKALYRISEK